MSGRDPVSVRLGLVIDLDRCTGCGACVIACAVEHNVPAVTCEGARHRGLTPMRIYQMSRGRPDGEPEWAFLPVPCQHCETNPPCVSVCPQNAVQVDPRTGVVGQIPQRCMGCRYCMAACPYHARYFNWMDPVWPAGQEAMLNPDVAPRTRGVVEKCNLCHGRLHIARELSAIEGKREILPRSFSTACEECCPTGAIRHVDLNDPGDSVRAALDDGRIFRLLENLGTMPKVLYKSRRSWVRNACRSGTPPWEGDRP